MENIAVSKLATSAKPQNVGSNVKKTKPKAMNIKTLNKIFAFLIILLNLYFLPFTIVQIISTGGAMGFGLLAIPFTFSINLLLIPAFFALKKKYENNALIFAFNSIGSIIAFALFILLITIPKMD